MSPADRPIADPERLVREFFDGTLPPERWTHDAHLAVGLHLVRRLPLEAAVDAMRDGLFAFLDRCRPDRSGYHATITRFYLHVIAAWAERHPPSGDPAADVAALVADVGARHLPAQFYGAGRLATEAARAGWVAPDLQPLPPLAADAPLRSVA